MVTPGHGYRSTVSCTLLASSPGLPMFFNVTREKSGRPGRFCDVIITYLPPFLPCYMPRPVEWWQVRNDYITKSTRPSRFFACNVEKHGKAWGRGYTLLCCCLHCRLIQQIVQCAESLHYECFIAKVVLNFV